MGIIDDDGGHDDGDDGVNYIGLVKNIFLNWWNTTYWKQEKEIVSIDILWWTEEYIIKKRIF